MQVGLLFIFILITIGCGDDDEGSPLIKGTCAGSPTNEGNGPTYCREDVYYNEEYCPEFDENAGCSDFGYTFCCIEPSSPSRIWRFKSIDDAEWHDDIYHESCASNPVSCSSHSAANSGGSSGGESTPCSRCLDRCCDGCDCNCESYCL